MTITRRDLLAGAAALTACSFQARRADAAPLPRDADVAIVGAGAAGVAAARKIAAAGRKVVILEATAAIGGRCLTDTGSFAVPFDRGARWLYGESNPLVDLARQAKVSVVPAPRGQKLRIERRNARAGETEDFLALLVRVNRSMSEAVRARGDAPASSLLPPDLREWRSTVDFTLGALPTGCDLKDVSAAELAAMAPRDPASACPQGVGTLMERLAENLPVALSTPVSAIRWGAKDAQIDTDAGTLTARSVIVTASTGVISAGKIRFTPDLPKRQLDALSKLALGSFDHVALDLPGNPLGLARDDVFIEQSTDNRTGMLLANAGGSSLCQVDVAGSFGRELSAQGEAAMAEFATEWLRKLFGGDVAKVVKKASVTRWNSEPYALGAMSAALPGGQSSRRILMEQLGSLFFAGEALHDTQWGTVGGAWLSGERAADAALRKLGGAKVEMPVSAVPDKRAKPQRRDTTYSSPSHGGLYWPGARY